MSARLEADIQVRESVLLARVARGETEAIVSLVRDHATIVYRFVLRRCSNVPEDAEDLVQETFLAAFELAGKFDGTCSVTTWLCSIAKIKVADHHRKQGRQKRVPKSMMVDIDAAGAKALADMHTGKASMESAIERIDAKAFLDGLIARLGGDEREALILHYVDGFSIEEIGRLLNRSAKGVEALLTRAKKKCREVAADWLTC